MSPEDINLIEAARRVLQAAGYYVDHLWHVNDVHFICEQLHMEKLDSEAVNQVFAIASEHFDGETGISWPQLERALHLYQQRRKAVKELCPPKPAAAKPRIEALW